MNHLSPAFPVRRLPRAVALAAACITVIAATFSGPAKAETESRNVADFDEVVFAVAGEVSIDQGAGESLSIEAEPKVLRKITAEVRDRRLVIGLSPGKVETQQPIRMKLGVRNLRAFESRTTGTIGIGALRGDTLSLVLAGGGSIRVERLENARSLDVRISGSGEVTIGGGKVTAQKLSITGNGSYSAPRLASEQADVTISGNGEVQLAASATLAVRISGIGNVRYHGDPAVTRSVQGIGSIEKD
ncbi:head GIN domain-containing protein [Variovorax sp. dw_954]|uniref:head GIN domain-containing protein n=1 Tax=Variovorax sp. dw_954 TaxID=2720078 RepID=UPI001BD3B916|nr:head GIN domain-containing protein [Variovorax sp. dw_954]